MDERAVASLSAASNAFMSFGPNMKTEDIVAATNSLSRAIGAYGQVPRGGPMRDNMESLRQVSFALRAFAESVQSAARMVGPVEQKSPEYQSLLQLGRNAEAALQMHLRRIAAMNRY